MTVIEIKYANLDEGYAPSLLTITIAGGSIHEQPIWRSRADKVSAEGREKGWKYTIENQPFDLDDKDAAEKFCKLPRIPESHKGEDADQPPRSLIGDAPRGS